MRFRERLRPWMFASSAWILLALLTASNEIVSRRLGHQTWALHDIVYSGGSGGWATLALYTPVIFAVSRRWPLVAGHLTGRLMLHFALALLFWAVVSLTFQGVLAGLINPHAREGATSAVALIGKLAERAYEWGASTVPAGVAVYAGTVAIEHAVRNFSDARDRDIQMARLAEQLSDARFAALQSQLNPHFLFNTLNTIAVRARDGDGPGTARMVEQLSEVLRRTLGRHRASEVTLEEELDLVREYLDIEQARFSDRLRVAFDVDETLLTAAVPSFSIQHLVENAVRHGISRRPGSGRLDVVVRRDGDALEAIVTDDGPGVPSTPSHPPGHGLDNTRQRLSVLYGDRASLTLRQADGDGATAALRVPYREAPVEASVA